MEDCTRIVSKGKSIASPQYDESEQRHQMACLTMTSKQRPMRFDCQTVVISTNAHRLIVCSLAARALELSFNPCDMSDSRGMHCSGPLRAIVFCTLLFRCSYLKAQAGNCPRKAVPSSHACNVRKLILSSLELLLLSVSFAKATIVPLPVFVTASSILRT